MALHMAVADDVFGGDLTLKAPITTAADDNHKYFFIVFQRKKDLLFQVNPLLGIFLER